MLGLGIGLMQNVAATSGGPPPSGATWNDSGGTPASSPDWILSSGNLTATRPSGTGDALLRASATRSSGSFVVHVTSGSLGIGVCTAAFSTSNWLGNVPGSTAYGADGNIYYNSSIVTTGATFTAGDDIKVAYDGTHIQFYKKVAGSFVAQGSAVDISGSIAAPYPAASSGAAGVSITADFSGW